jgi:hypothetical protein
MRMWNVDPKLMCRQHLLGEHLEMHMFRTAIISRATITGFLNNGLVNLGQIKLRHDELAREMARRNYNHRSPMNKFKEGKLTTVDVEKNIKELCHRCPACRLRITSFAMETKYMN